MIRSPLNYTGGKHKLLPQILPFFPRDVGLFVDLFCGGCNVGLNAPGMRTVYNDKDANLMGLYNTFKAMDKSDVLKGVYEIIEAYGLSLVSRYGYARYGCNSSRGLSTYNKKGFFELRNDFNRKYTNGEKDAAAYLMLYVLIVYSFNNQIRFNAKGEFNLPVGKRDFNKSMEQKLLVFLETIQTRDCVFTCGDFRAFDFSSLSPHDFVYADPPYLITCATYNEKGGWDEAAERDLLSLLDQLHQKKIRFALSNVLRSKGKENDILLDWLRQNAGRYTAIPLICSYANSNYQTKDRTSASEEVLIVNY